MAADGPDAGRLSDRGQNPVLRGWLAGAPASRAAAFLRDRDHDDDPRGQGDLDLLVGFTNHTAVSASVTVFHNLGGGVFDGGGVLLDQSIRAHWFLLSPRGR